MADAALVMKTNGVEWNGSFGVALRSLVKDVLSDGEPFTATIRHQGSGYETIVFEDCSVERATVDGILVTHKGERTLILWEHIFELEMN